jgi:hypothetical protein
VAAKLKAAAVSRVGKAMLLKPLSATITAMTLMMPAKRTMTMMTMMATMMNILMQFLALAVASEC